MDSIINFINVVLECFFRLTCIYNHWMYISSLNYTKDYQKCCWKIPFFMPVIKIKINWDLETTSNLCRLSVRKYYHDDNSKGTCCMLQDRSLRRIIDIILENGCNECLYTIMYFVVFNEARTTLIDFFM